MIRRLLLLAGVLLALALVAPLILLAVGIQVDVSRYGPQIAQAASRTLGREVSLEGPIYVVPSYWPTLEIHGLRIADPFGPDGAEFASLTRARVVLEALPLLRRRLALDAIEAEGVRLNLVRYPDGRASWAFDAGPQAPEKAPGDEPTGEAPVLDELEELALYDVAVAWRDLESGESADLVLEECLGVAVAGEPIRLTLLGSFRDHPFAARLGAGHLEDLLRERPAMPLDLEVEVAGAVLELGMQLQELERARESAARFAGATGHYWMAFEVARLDGLDDLLGIDLPPLGPVRLRARADLESDAWKLSQLELQVGETRLAGTASLVRGKERPRAILELASPRFRLDDFTAEDWSLLRGAPDPAPADAADADAGEPRRSLVDPEVMRTLDGRVSLRVEDVLLGDESLGGGELAASLGDGRFLLDPVSIRIPGGAFAMQASLASRPSEVSAHLAMQVEAFDLGVAARSADPDTEMGGIVDLDLEIRSLAREPAALMAHADGHLDFSFAPQNLEAGTLDLWAVNLMAAVLPVVAGGESHVNCVVALLDLTDGRMTTHSLLIDTTRIQVSGRIEADFERRRVDGVFQPRPKKPQFFSLGTPVQVSGDFSDFGVGVSAVDMAGTVVRVVTDVATYPARFLFMKRASPDGAEACAAARSREPTGN